MAPTLAVSEEVHADRYRGENETHRDYANRVANALKDNQEHFYKFRDALLEPRFLPAGRIQASIGSTRHITPWNCFVSQTIPDSMDGIMGAVAEAAQTLRLGGGIGYDFSTLRPFRDLITTLQSTASGPISFMDVFDSLCGTIRAAGHRRGAQMGILRVDHPDIVDFVKAKQPRPEVAPLWEFVRDMDDGPAKAELMAALQYTIRLRNFNISVAITDEFMQAVEAGSDFDLRFNDRKHASIDAKALWEEIMRSTWDWAEPGVIFIDAMNRMNNLWYCEKIAATNPCSEQPLPPHGACLLGSFNLVRYVSMRGGKLIFDFDQFVEDIHVAVRAMDNIIDRGIYPLKQQEHEGKSKRRMGLGVTGVANTLEALGYSYGSPEYLDAQDRILMTLRDECYRASCLLAEEKGSFPLFDKASYMKSEFVRQLPSDIRKMIAEHGIRNSHLTSIAPTGTISVAADNVSSGIEPVFSYEYDRRIRGADGDTVFRMQDYGVARFGVRGRTALECTASEHVDVLCRAQRYVDSAVSKTCNVGPNVTWDEFSEIYFRAWRGGAKGCATHRADGMLIGVLSTVKDSDKRKESPAACVVNEDGTRSCEE